MIENWFTYNLHMDSDGRAAFHSWKAKHPHGTLEDWWNLQAHKKSGGTLPNPMDDPDVAARLKRC